MPHNRTSPTWRRWSPFLSCPSYKMFRLHKNPRNNFIKVQKSNYRWLAVKLFGLPYPRLHLGRCSSLQLHCCDFRIFRNQSQLHHCEVQSLASAPSHSAAKVAFVKFVDRISGSFYRLTVSRAGGEQFSAYIKYSCCYQENHFPNRYKSMFYTRHKNKC